MAAYLTPDDLRPGTSLYADTEVGPDISDERVETEIATQQSALERECGEVFEVRTLETLSIPGTGTTDLLVSGYTLRSADAVVLLHLDGTETELDPGTYRVRPWGIELLSGRKFDQRDTVVIYDAEVGNPDGLSDAKRAVALLVFEALTGSNIGRHHAKRWTNGEVWFEIDTNPDIPFGLPEVDRFVRRWRNGQPAVGAI